MRLFETRLGERFVLVDDVVPHGHMRILAGFRFGAEGMDNRWAHLTDVEADAQALLDVQGDGVPELIMRATYRAPESIAGVAFAGDLSEPTFAEDWTPVPPKRLEVGGYAVPDFSVFRPRLQ